MKKNNDMNYDKSLCFVFYNPICANNYNLCSFLPHLCGLDFIHRTYIFSTKVHFYRRFHQAQAYYNTVQHKKLLGSLYYFLVEHIHRCSLDFSFGGGRSFLGDGSKYPPLGSNNSSVTPNFMSKCFLPPTKSTTENRFMVL